MKTKKKIKFVDSLAIKYNQLVNIDNDFIANEIITKYNNILQKSSETYSSGDNSGGKVRQLNGNLVEEIFQTITYLLLLKNNLTLENYKLTGKKKDSVKVTSKNGFFFASVDVHVRIPRKPSIFTECKAYLDKCYLDRASSDFRHLKKATPNSVSIVLCLENGIADESEAFFMDEGYIDKIFYLVDGKRSPTRPIWKIEYYKPINRKKLDELIQYVEQIII